jgi:hypothetical protein
MIDAKKTYNPSRWNEVPMRLTRIDSSRPNNARVGMMVFGNLQLSLGHTQIIAFELENHASLRCRSESDP